MNAATVDKRRERKTEEQVIAEVKNVLGFARDFFKSRGKVILSTNIDCQLKYFTAAECFDALEEQEDLAVSGKAH
jgi:hypothetical protein